MTETELHITPLFHRILCGKTPRSLPDPQPPWFLFVILQNIQIKNWKNWSGRLAWIAESPQTIFRSTIYISTAITCQKRPCWRFCSLGWFWSAYVPWSSIIYSSFQSWTMSHPLGSCVHLAPRKNRSSESFQRKETVLRSVSFHLGALQAGCCPSW